MLQPQVSKPPNPKDAAKVPSAPPMTAAAKAAAKMKPTAPFYPSFRYYPQEGYRSQFAEPSSDLKAIQKRLEKKWVPDDRINQMQRKVKEFALMHGCRVKELKDPIPLGQQQQPTLGPGAAMASLQSGEAEEQAQEMQILAKVVQDGEDARQMHAAETAVANYLKTGMRSYIDYALDEVDRYTRMAKSGQAADFNWTAQGHHSDNPGLRRSIVLKSVSDGLEEDEVFSKTPPELDEEEREDDDFPPFEMDFYSDFSQSQARWANTQMVKAVRTATTAESWRPREKEISVKETALKPNLPGLSRASSASKLSTVSSLSLIGEGGRRPLSREEDAFARSGSQWLARSDPRFSQV